MLSLEPNPIHSASFHSQGGRFSDGGFGDYNSDDDYGVVRGAVGDGCLVS